MSVDKEIIKQVSRIEFSIRKILSGMLIGAYNTSLRGQGMTFSDLRQYTPGDDIRNFAWQVMARTGEPFVKQFEEERDLEVHISLDIGSSMAFGGSKHSKFLIQAYNLALIGLSAAKLGDKFGLSLFADNMKKIIPVSKGEDHLRRSLLNYLEYEEEAVETSSVSNANLALKHFTRLRKKHCMCFLISDFNSKLDEKLIAMVRQKHKLTLIHIYDPYEESMPNVGWLNYKSLNEKLGIINTSRSFFKKDQINVFNKKMNYLKNTARRTGVSLINQSTHDDKMLELIKNLKLRSSRGL